MICLSGKIPTNDNGRVNLTHYEAMRILCLIHTSMIELYNELPPGMKHAASLEIEAINYAINYMDET